MRAGRYWMPLSRFVMIAVSWPASLTARLPRPFFMFAQAPSTALRPGAQAGRRGPGQPVRASVDEGAHRGADVGVQVIPNQNDRGMPLVVRGGDQAGVAGFGHRAALALAPVAGASPAGQAGPRAGLGAGQPRDRDLARALTGHPHHRGVATGAPVRAFGRRRSCPASPSKHKHAPVAAASLEASPRSARARRRSPAHPARRPGGRAPAGHSRAGAADTRSRAGHTGRGTAGRSAWPPAPAPTADPGPTPRRPGRPPARPATAHAAPRSAGTPPPPAPFKASAASPPARAWSGLGWQRSDASPSRAWTGR